MRKFLFFASVLLLIAACLGLSSRPANAAQESSRKPPAVYAGPNFSIRSSEILQTGKEVLLRGPVEFRMWDPKNPSWVTLIQIPKGMDLNYDLATSVVRTTGSATVKLERTPNPQTESNRTLLLPSN